MARFVVAVSSLVVVLVSTLGVGCGPNVPVPDAGIPRAGGLSGAGGGTSATGGGTSGTGGGMAGSAGGSAAVDAGCIALPAITPASNIPGAFTIGTGGNAGLEFWTGQIAFVANGSVNIFPTELYQQPPNRVSFPFTGMIPSNTNFANCQVCLQAALGCDQMGNNCQSRFLATSGSYSFAEGTQSPDAGRFVANVTGLTYRAWNFQNDVAVDGGSCFTVPTISFTAVWPFNPDGGM